MAALPAAPARGGVKMRASKSLREDIAQKIANLILRNTPSVGAIAELEWNHFGNYLVGVLDHVWIDRHIDYKRNSWNASGSGFIAPCKPKVLQNEIDRKKSKPANYLQQYAEIWLVVVFAFGEPSAWLEITPDTVAPTYNSSFDKTFVLSSDPSGVFELKTSKVMSSCFHQRL